jgi:hypothetical protein
MAIDRDIEEIEEMEKQVKKESKIKAKDERIGKKFSQKVKDWLLYVGFASALISIGGYIAVTIVMIKGFTSAFELQNQIMFSLVGAGIGLIITFSLRYQGIAFAKAEDESKAIMTAYYEAQNKDKPEEKMHDINHYMFWKSVKDVVIKGVFLVVMTTLVIDIFSKGNGDWSLLWLMVFNILMFTGFGLMAIAGAYDHYIEQHIPVIKQRTERLLAKKDSHGPYTEAYSQFANITAKRDLRDGEVVNEEDYTINESNKIEEVPCMDLQEDYDKGNIKK